MDIRCAEGFLDPEGNAGESRSKMDKDESEEVIYWSSTASSNASVDKRKHAKRIDFDKAETKLKKTKKNVRERSKIAAESSFASIPIIQKKEFIEKWIAADDRDIGTAGQEKTNGFAPIFASSMVQRIVNKSKNIQTTHPEVSTRFDVAACSDAREILEVEKSTIFGDRRSRRRISGNSSTVVNDEDSLDQTENSETTRLEISAGFNEASSRFLRDPSPVLGSKKSKRPRGFLMATKDEDSTDQTSYSKASTLFIGASCGYATGVQDLEKSPVLRRSRILSLEKSPVVARRRILDLEKSPILGSSRKSRRRARNSTIGGNDRDLMNETNVFNSTYPKISTRLNEASSTRILDSEKPPILRSRNKLKTSMLRSQESSLKKKDRGSDNPIFASTESSLGQKRRLEEDFWGVSTKERKKERPKSNCTINALGFPVPGRIFGSNLQESPPKIKSWESESPDSVTIADTERIEEPASEALLTPKSSTDSDRTLSDIIEDSTEPFDPKPSGNVAPVEKVSSGTSSTVVISTEMTPPRTASSCSGTRADETIQILDSGKKRKKPKMFVAFKGSLGARLQKLVTGKISFVRLWRHQASSASFKKSSAQFVRLRVIGSSMQYEKQLFHSNVVEDPFHLLDSNFEPNDSRADDSTSARKATRSEENTGKTVTVMTNPEIVGVVKMTRGSFFKIYPPWEILYQGSDHAGGLILSVMYFQHQSKLEVSEDIETREEEPSGRREIVQKFDCPCIREGRVVDYCPIKFTDQKFNLFAEIFRPR